MTNWQALRNTAGRARRSAAMRPHTMPARGWRHLWHGDHGHGGWIAGSETFDEFFAMAVGEDVVPYAHQRALAESGLPTVLTAPTGTGKTEAAVLGHLYRRHRHPHQLIRSETPRWLVIALPTRGLVNQTLDRVRGWVDNLDLPEVDVHAVLGGEGWDDRAWRAAPRRDAVFVGTVDMLLSRALNRGYADSRWSWPISFGLFNNGTQWVFDEIQQMELAAVNSRQLQAFRTSMGTVLPTRSMWMSATLDRSLLQTVDAPDIDSHVDAMALGAPSAELQRRTQAPKRLDEVAVSDRKRHAREVADHALARHRPGTLTLLVANTVVRAQEIARYLEKAGDAPPVTLLHRRFRPVDRRVRTEEALEPIDPAGPGRIVVSTQVLEAGIDIDAAALVTELAPWPSIVQRAGRCNRAGLTDGAELWWVDLDEKDAAPYEPGEMDDARAALRDLNGTTVSPALLGDTGPPPCRRVHHVLRRRDLLELFDTSADLSGDALDVSQFIRDGDERDVYLAWRDEVSPEMDAPRTDELCPVSIGEASKWLEGSQRAIRQRDPRAVAGAWTRAGRNDLRPGQLYIVAAKEGGYDPAVGWSQTVKAAVPPVRVDAADVGFGDDSAVAAEPASMLGSWYPLTAHLHDVDRVAGQIIDSIASGLPDALRQACVDAAALHDLGKAHDVWQRAAMLAGGESSEAPGQAVAKTPGRGRLRFEQPHFRHELASLVALRGHASGLLAGTEEPVLCCYLVAAHHGRVRLSIRSIPGERLDEDRAVMLGVVHGSPLPATETPRGESPEGSLDLVGAATTWTRDALALRDRSDLGPFRLAFLEAVVRLADWEASRLITEEPNA